MKFISCLFCFVFCLLISVFYILDEKPQKSTLENFEPTEKPPIDHQVLTNGFASEPNSPLVEKPIQEIFQQTNHVESSEISSTMSSATVSFSADSESCKFFCFCFLNLVIVFCDPRSFLKYLLSDNAEVDINPKDELVFLKGSKGLMAAISITNRTSSLIAFKIKTTSPGIIHFEKSHYKYQYTIHYIVKKFFLSFFL